MYFYISGLKCHYPLLTYLHISTVYFYFNIYIVLTYTLISQLAIDLLAGVIILIVPKMLIRNQPEIHNIHTFDFLQKLVL